MAWLFSIGANGQIWATSIMSAKLTWPSVTRYILLQCYERLTVRLLESRTCVESLLPFFDGCGHTSSIIGLNFEQVGQAPPERE